MIEISRTSLESNENQRMEGFNGLNQRIGCTKPWLRLQSIGLSSVLDERDEFPYSTVEDEFAPHAFKNEYYTGKVLLDMRGSGIRERIFIGSDVGKDRSISDFSRISFKTEVFGALKTVIPDCEEYFRLLLHYNMGGLVRLQFENRTKRK